MEVEEIMNYIGHNQFSDDFYHYRGKDIKNKEINEMIYKLNKKVSTKEEDYGIIKRGNTAVIKIGDKIIIAKNYWENGYFVNEQ